MLLSPPTSPAPPSTAQAGSLRRPRSARQRTLGTDSPVSSDVERPPPRSRSNPDDDEEDDEAGPMRRTRSKTGGDASQGESARSSRHETRPSETPRRAKSTASTMSAAAKASGGLSTPRSPGTPRLASAARPSSSPSSHKPRHQAEAGRSSPRPKQLYSPRAERPLIGWSGAAAASGLERAVSTGVLRDFGPKVPSSPPSPFLPDAFAQQHALALPSRPRSSASVHARALAGQRSCTASPQPSPREAVTGAAARPKRRISLHLPAEGEQQRTPLSQLGWSTLDSSDHAMSTSNGEPSSSAQVGAERSLRDVLGRLEERPASSSSGVGSATLGRVRKTFLRGKSATLLRPPGRFESEAATALERERAAQESEREVARWADGGEEVPQAVLFAEQERLSPLGEVHAAYGEGLMVDDAWNGAASSAALPAALRKRPSQGRMVSSPATFGSRTPTGQPAAPPLSPSAGLRAMPLPTSYIAQPFTAAKPVGDEWSSKKRTHSSASSIASSIYRPAGGSIATMASIRSEMPPSSSSTAWARSQQQQQQQLGSTLRALTTPAAPSLAHSLAAPSSPVFARPTLPASRATERGPAPSRSVSQPPLLLRRTTAPPSPGQPMTTALAGVDDSVSTSATREPSFDLDRCVARVNELGDSYVSFASVGVGQPEEEHVASPADDGPKRGWWSWLGGASMTTEPRASTAGAA